MAKSNFPLEDFNELQSYEELKNQMNVSDVSEEEFSKAIENVLNWTDDEFEQVFISSLHDEKMKVMLDFFRKSLYQSAIEDKDEEVASLFRAPFLNIEIFMVATAIQMGLMRGDSEYKELVKEFRKDGALITLHIVRLIGELRKDPKVLGQMLELENKIEW